ncbi:MAG: restriction endonuclease subunit S [Phycisphaerales bacterium]
MRRTPWETVAIADVADLGSGTTPLRARGALYYGEGTCWVKTGDLNNTFIRRTEESLTAKAIADYRVRVYPSGTVLIAMYGGFRQIGRTGLLKRRAAINQALTALELRNGVVTPRFLQIQLNARIHEWRRLAGSSRKDPNITKEDIARFKIDVPPPDLQAHVVALYDSMENMTATLRRLTDAKRRMRDGVAAELLTGRRRLPEFDRRPWRDVRLGEVTRESTRRNGERLGADRVMAVTKSIGLTPMRDRTMSDSLTRYKVLCPGGFAYNPMRLNIGSIARSSLKHDVLVSPDYVVFEADPESLDPRFLDYTRRAHAWRRFMMAAGSGGVRIRIYYDDFARMKLQLPDKAEQSAIADILDTAFQEIACLTLLRETIAKQKRGLMQGLLTGKIRIKEDSHG